MLVILVTAKRLATDDPCAAQRRSDRGFHGSNYRQASIATPLAGHLPDSEKGASPRPTSNRHLQLAGFQSDRMSPRTGNVPELKEDIIGGAAAMSATLDRPGCRIRIHVRYCVRSVSS